LPTALSHKLAAWNERRLWRDVHDLWFLHSQLGTALDLAVLDQRLLEVRPKRGKPFSMSRQELAEQLRTAARSIDRGGIVEELGDTLPPSDLEGVELRLAATMARLATVLDPTI
jgi:chromosome condensin MukBEF MukE localization factor